MRRNSLVVEKQASIIPSNVSIIPTSNDLLRPYLLVTLPKGIDSIAIGRRKIVATQFCMILLIANSLAINGRATEMFAKNAVTNETTAARSMTDFSLPIFSVMLNMITPIY